MPDVNVRGRYRAFTYDGASPLNFTTYANNVSVIRRPNEISFVTLRQYIPGISAPFTTFEPGSAYVVVSRDNDASFTMGPYTRVDRLPSSLNVKSPQYYLGLDKNSITIPLSVYALSVNTPLSSVTGITYVNGSGVSQSTVTVDQIRNGFQTSFTHFLPNSGYQLRNRVPFTFFAPLQSEMGDAFALGNNSGGEYGMGYRYSQTSRFEDPLYNRPFVLSADQTFGIWDKIVFNNENQNVTWNSQTFLASSLAALSSHGASKALFVLGSNLYSQLGTGSSQQYYPTWTRVPGQWLDVEMGAHHMIATNTQGHLYACGSNQYGQLGLASGVASVNILTLVDNTRNYVQLATTNYSTSLRNANGAVYSCGKNDNGQLGIGNTISPVYTLTRESTNAIWLSIKTIKEGCLVGLRNDNALYGCGRPESFWGGPTVFQRNSFTGVKPYDEDITDFYTTGLGTLIKRRGQDYLFARGSTFATLTAPGDYYTKTAIPSNIRSIFSYKDFKNFNNTFYFGYVGSDFFVYAKHPFSNIFTKKQFNAFDSFSSNGAAGVSPVFLLNNDSNLRPSPTPTPTITPTPTPTPSPLPSPANVLQVSIFGGNFATGNSNRPTSNQYYAYNSPGNLNSNFTFRSQEPNGGYVPPGSIQSSTFDYEKGNFNNIVGIGINNYTGTGQSPAGRYNPRYIYKKIGPRWEYTLLPSDLDANTIRREYNAPGDGCDTLLITPPHPGYANTSQGVYNLIYVRNRRWREAISYDRGLTWNTYSIEDRDNYYSNTGTNKMIYSRSRSNNYKVCVAGCRTGTTQLIFAQRFPDLNFKEIIFTVDTVGTSGLGNIGGVDFKHDYNDIPTVLSSLRNSSSTGSLILIRKINGSWQTVIVKQGIARFCAPNVTDPSTQTNRLNSPNLSLELDPTNNNLIYIAYLRYGSNPAVAAYINVLCYNMASNTVVFDESVVRATGAQGVTESAFYSVNSVLADVPILFYNKSNSSLNLFFIGYSDLSNPRDKNLMMSRINGSWTAPANIFTSSTIMSNNRELRIKY